jgi:uncharacterized protein with HEPN domain
MSKRADQEFLSDIREALQRISAYVAGMTYESFRDRLIHHYFGTNLDIVWQIATVELRQVASQLKTIEDTSE